MEATWHGAYLFRPTGTVSGSRPYPLHQYFVKPDGIDTNENLLSDIINNCYSSISHEKVIEGNILKDAIHKFDKEVASKLEGKFTLLTDGQLPIRQCIFPEAWRKNIILPEYMYRFHDLRKEFSSMYPNVIVNSIEDMINHLGLKLNEAQDVGVREVYDMRNIIIRLLQQGHKFHEPEVVQSQLEQGIISKHDEINPNCSVRARGLPWQASDQDIADFFIGLNIAKGGVALCLSSQGRRNGEALLLFETEDHRDMALKRHKHHLGSRYIEVYKASGDDFLNVAGGSNAEAQEFLSRGGQVIIRMRGLPYDATSIQVGMSQVMFFEQENGILFVRKHDGKATGDAFVLFKSENDAQKALQKHKEVIGSRYIELFFFRSTTAEVQQVLNRSAENKSNNSNNSKSNTPAPLLQGQQMPLLPGNGQLSVLPQQLITSGTKRDCIRLRGLPYEAQVEAILEFLEEHGKCIVYQGIHMVYNSQHPSHLGLLQTGINSSGINLPFASQIGMDSPALINSLHVAPQPNPLLFPNTAELQNYQSAQLPWNPQQLIHPLYLPQHQPPQQPTQHSLNNSAALQANLAPLRLGLQQQILPHPHLNPNVVPRFPIFSFNPQLMPAPQQNMALPHPSVSSCGKRSFHQAFNSPSVPSTASNKRNNVSFPSITANATMYANPIGDSGSRLSNPNIPPQPQFNQ
ncbi:ESRP1_2 [Lepeophtheirus salmonis]|uniref:ESRP1_2 n=1 Tax=Lepeophtheirus salmonis TaxID=72036 RepID=A0A7R8H5J8_LEPSM|nr:ESRP1_2 [Lepeophtheirus salmonis]CAF2881720.1 ESRP1_2 [Lepeophtheirus salmonis]